MIYKDIYVSKNEPFEIPLVQASNAVTMYFNYKDWTPPAAGSCQIYVKKPSGNLIYNSGTIDGNTLIFPTTTQMTAEVGGCDAQISVINGNTVLHSFKFIIRVQESIIDNSAVESSDEFTALEAAISAATGYAVKADLAGKGSATNPVYINDAGKAVATTYALNKTVPSDAVFTDTKDLTQMTDTLPVNHGGTGQTTVSGVRGWLRSVRYPDTTDSVGSETNPVYIDGGLTRSCTYSLNKSVPSDAVFTDTKDLTQMTGTLGVGHGGTGVTTLADLRDAMRAVRYQTGTTDVGSATSPIYIDDGLARSCSYSLNKTVPADAVFTDTTALESMTGTLGILHGGTGATTKADARASLEVMGLTNGYETSNLNNCTDRGFYTYNSGASNTPTASSGSLLVLRTSDTYQYQLAFPNVSGSSPAWHIYARLHNDSGWTSWTQVI